MWRQLRLILICILLSHTYVCKITQSKGKFIDEYGRTRIFHGVNIVYKLPPYIPANDKFDPYLSFTADEDIKYLKQFGFNLVRLGVMWEAIETSPGVYDEELLAKYERLVNLLGENGIYTIVDAHQDLFSRRLCGEGVPDFHITSADYDKTCRHSILGMFMHLIGVCKGISEYKYREDEKGLPLIEDCKKSAFFMYNTSPDITSLYQKLYDNEGGLLDKFISFWQKVAERFKGNKYVIGYDIWNEPFPGELYKHPSRLVPGKADDEQLLPFYRKVDTSLREIDEDFLLMFEPNPFPDYLPLLFWKVTGTFSEAPLSGKYANKQVYNFHSYCCQASFDMCAKGEPEFESYNECKKFHIDRVTNANNYAKKFNMPSIITEFGACFNSPACYNEISLLADAADDALTSWAYWMYKPFNDFTTSCPDDKEGLFNADGSIQEFKIRALTRTFAQAVQGETTYMKFDKDSKLFVIKYTLNASINQPTLIYMNKLQNYPDGYKLIASHQGFTLNESEENIVEILYPEDSESNSKEITVMIMKVFK